MAIKIKYHSFLDDIEKDMVRAERHVLNRAGRHMVRAMRKKIKNRRRSSPGQPPGRNEGKLYKGIASKVIMPPRNKPFQAPVVIVGASAPGYHLHLVELGTKERFKKSGKSTGKIEERPFMKQVFREETNAIENILGDRRVW